MLTIQQNFSFPDNFAITILKGGPQITQNSSRFRVNGTTSWAPSFSEGLAHRVTPRTVNSCLVVNLQWRHLSDNTPGELCAIFYVVIQAMQEDAVVM